MSSKRQKLSGSAYKKNREERRTEDARSAERMRHFLTGSSTSSSEQNQEVGEKKQENTPPRFVHQEKPAEEFESDDEDEDSAPERQRSEDSQLQSASSDSELETAESGSGDEAAEDSQVFRDAGVWKIPLPEDVKVELVSRGPANLQHKDGPFEAVEKQGSRPETRNLTKDWFYCSLKNGERILRSWMLYSPVSKCLYCFCCRLFLRDQSGQTGKQTQSAFAANGFRRWWKLNPKVAQHENSKEHQLAFEKWKELEMRLNKNQTLDKSLQEQVETEKRKWVGILHRVVDVILFLAKQNLPLRGHRESLDGGENPGNFLELIKLISKYDPVLRVHMAQQMTNKITVSYFSARIQNEFIELLGRHVRQKIVDDIKGAKYYAMMFDSTPDLSHTDQMTQIIRYVKIEEGTVEVVESFIDFIPCEKKTAAEITAVILKKLRDDGIPIEDCRGQGYDNAATMAGIHSGVQQRINEVNSKAEFVACTNHTLNLAGVHAGSESVNSITFFGTVERVYTFFSSSTHRWDVLMSGLPKTVKRVVDTRWSARKDAVEVIHSHFDKVIDALESLTDPAENADTRGDANIVITSISNFTFLCFLELWGRILPEVDHAQKYLQILGLSLEKAVTKIQALKMFFDDERDQLVVDAVAHATTKCQQLDIEIERRVRRRRRMDGEEARDEAAPHQEQVRRELLQVVDRLREEISRRFQQINTIYERFGFTQFTMLMNGDQDEFIYERIDAFTEVYDEVSGNELKTEISRLRRHVHCARERNQALGDNNEDVTALTLLQWIVKWGFQESLPNLTVVLRILLTICVSVASCERSFSKLKLIKTYLRSTMSQLRLSSLALLSVERQVAETLNFNSVINDFASLKARKVRI